MLCATGWKSEISRRQGGKGVSLPASELVSSQNYAGLRGWTRTGRPYPTFHGIHKPSTCGFDFTDYSMLGDSRPGPVNRHGFEIAGSAGARLAPDNGPGAGGMVVGRMAARGVEAKTGERRNPRCPGGAGEEGGGSAAARGARPAGRIRHRGSLALESAPRSRPSGARASGKFFQNCPCIGGGVPV